MRYIYNRHHDTLSVENGPSDLPEGPFYESAQKLYLTYLPNPPSFLRTKRLPTLTLNLVPATFWLPLPFSESPFFITYPKWCCNVSNDVYFCVKKDCENISLNLST